VLFEENKKVRAAKYYKKVKSVQPATKTGLLHQGCQVQKKKKAKLGHKQFQKRPNPQK